MTKNENQTVQVCKGVITVKDGPTMAQEETDVIIVMESGDGCHTVGIGDKGICFTVPTDVIKAVIAAHENGVSMS